MCEITKYKPSYQIFSGKYKEANSKTEEKVVFNFLTKELVSGGLVASMCLYVVSLNLCASAHFPCE